MTRLQLATRMALPALLVLALVGCGPSQSADASAAGRSAASRDPAAGSGSPAGTSAASASVEAGRAADPCGLLTDAELQQTTGYPIRSKESLEGNGGSFASGCRWVLDTDKGVPGLHTISLEVRSSGGRARFDFLREGLTQVPGLGDGAVKAGGNTAGTIWAVTGDRLVKLDYSLPVDVVDPDPKVLPLVEKVLSNL